MKRQAVKTVRIPNQSCLALTVSAVRQNGTERTATDCLASLCEHLADDGQRQAEVPGDLSRSDACHKGRSHCVALPLLQCECGLG